MQHVRTNRRELMSSANTEEQQDDELTVHVFSISAGLVGVCLTAIGLVRLITQGSKMATIADDLLAADAFLFMVCCNLSFWSFKLKKAERRRWLRSGIDSLFMAALALMVAICAMIAYTIA